MTQNERRLLSIFIWTCIGTIFVFVVVTNIDRLQTAKKSERLYVKALEKIVYDNTKLKALTERLEILKSKSIQNEETKTGQTTAFLANDVRSSLAKFGIKPNRYQISGNATDETIEFVLHCDSLSFLKYLKSETELPSRFLFVNMSIKPVKESHLMDVVFRVRYAK